MTIFAIKQFENSWEKMRLLQIKPSSIFILLHIQKPHPCRACISILKIRPALSRLQRVPVQGNGSPVLPCRFVCWLSGSPNMRRSSSPDIIQRKVTKQKFPNLCLSSCLVAFLANLISPTFTEDGPYKGSLMEL